MIEIIVLSFCVIGAIVIDRFATPKPPAQPVGEIVYLSNRAKLDHLDEQQIAESFGNWYEEDKSIN